jgi:hypothetical protein
MAIGPDGLRASGDGFETFLAWKHVARVVTDLDHVFFLTLSTPKSIQGHAVPRGGFPTEFEFIEFARLAEGYWKAAHSAPAPQTRS